MINGSVCRIKRAKIGGPGAMLQLQCSKLVNSCLHLHFQDFAHRSEMEYVQNETALCERKVTELTIKNKVIFTTVMSFPTYCA